MNSRLEGIVTPVVTPLENAGGLDRESVHKHQNFLIERGICAIFVLGTTGEGPALPGRVQREMIECSAEAIGGRIPLLAGISSAALEDSLEQARFAAEHGADGVVAAPPCYLPAEEGELLDFYRILTKEQPLPVYVYNMPAMTKIEMSPQLILRIAELPGIAGYKDSSGNFAAFEKIAASLRNRQDFSLFMGTDLLLGKAIAAGASGGVNSGSNIVPELFVRLRKAALEGNTDELLFCQSRIEALQQIYFFRKNICCGVAAGLKYALSLLGLCGTAMTRPACPMEYHQEIVDFVRTLRRPESGRRGGNCGS